MWLLYLVNIVRSIARLNIKCNNTSDLMVDILLKHANIVVQTYVHETSVYYLYSLQNSK